MEITGEKIRLRPLKLEDAPEFERLLGNDRDAIFQTERLPFPCTAEGAREWIALRTEPGMHSFAILRAEDGDFAGCIGIGGPPGRIGMGYWIGRIHWNRGYASEAVRLMIGLARQLGIPEVRAEAFAENPASSRVLLKAGFEEHPGITRDLPHRGGVRQVRVFSWRADP
jgi:RimJ/RimL family protein N-acetyltransferase